MPIFSKSVPRCPRTFGDFYMYVWVRDILGDRVESNFLSVVSSRVFSFAAIPPFHTISLADYSDEKQSLNRHLADNTVRLLDGCLTGLEPQCPELVRAILFIAKCGNCLRVDWDKQRGVLIDVILTI